MKKFAEFRDKDNKKFKAFAKTEGQSEPHLFHVSVNRVRPNGTLAWVGTSIWNSSTSEWLVWQKELPVTRETLEAQLQLREKGQ